LQVAAVEGGGILTLFDDSNSGVCFGDSGGAATLNGLIVGTVQSGGGNCAEGNFHLFADMQINGNVNFIKQYIPSAIFE